MLQEIDAFIESKKITPFSEQDYHIGGEPIFKTKEAKQIQARIFNFIRNHFVFESTSCLLELFALSCDAEEMKRRSDFLITLAGQKQRTFLHDLKKPVALWKVPYSFTVLVFDESDYQELRRRKVPVTLVESERDLRSAQDYDIVKVLGESPLCRALESRDVLFLSNVDDCYLESPLQLLSGWKENLLVLRENLEKDGSAQEVVEIKEIVKILMSLFHFVGIRSERVWTRELLEKELSIINRSLLDKVKELTLSGDALVKVLEGSTYPPTLASLITSEIQRSGLPGDIFVRGVPLRFDEKEIGSFLVEQERGSHYKAAKAMLSERKAILEIPSLLARLERALVRADFLNGLSGFIRDGARCVETNTSVRIDGALNVFLENPEPISFLLDATSKCSILTGANSGGKTTLLEHVLQLICLHQMGFPVLGNVDLPVFKEVYYFAKNKGSASKGAFETLLTQLSKVHGGPATLILTDELEAVTEPGVAARIIAATCEHFTQQGCFMVMATHLGFEIARELPELCRIDGIEAKGLDENFELIVDHNPVLGYLAHSTPELIVERLAGIKKNMYLTFMHEKLREQKR